MKRSWQRILAMFCAMMLILTGVLAVGFAEEAPAENAAPVETEELTVAPVEEPVTADTAADNIEAIEAPAQEAEAPAAEEPAQEAEAPVAVEEVAQETEVPVVAEEPAQETEAPAVAEEPAQETEAPAVVEEPAQETEVPVVAEEPAQETEAPVLAEEPAQETETPVVAEEVAQETEAPVVEEPAQATEAPVVEEPAQETEAPVTEEPVQETEAPVTEEPAQETEAPVAEEPAQETETPVTEEPAQETEAPAAETDQSSETPAPVEEPVAEAEATEAPVEELIPADLTLKTLTSGEGVAAADHPYIVRLVSNVTGKVKVTLEAASALLVQFGKDGEEASREIMPNEDGELSFTFGAEFEKTYLLYIYSVGVNAETGLAIESAPFRIYSEKVEPTAEEPAAEEPAAEEPAAEEPAAEEPVAEEPIAEEPAAEKPAAEEPIAEEPAAEEPAAEEPVAEEEALVIYEQADPEEDEEIDEYETALGLYEVQYVMTAKEADIRTEADGMSPIMATVEEGTALKGFVTDDGDWMLIVYNGELGYVYKKDLASEEKPVEDAVEAAVEETAEETIEEPVDETVEEIPAEVAEEETAEEETAEVEEELPELKVTIFTSRRVTMSMGEPVYLTSELEGFEGLETEFQWECDKGEGFEPVEGANEDHYTFTADADSLDWGWKLLVYYR